MKDSTQNNGFGRGQNEFNSAYLYLIRTDLIFKSLNNAKYLENMRDYIKCLRILFHEISTEMSEEEKEEMLKIFKEKDIEFRNTSIYYSKNKVTPTFEIDEKLEEIELKLRRIYKEAGLQNKTKEDWTQPDEDW